MKHRVVKVQIDRESMAQLESIKGAILKKIGFVSSEAFSPVSLLVFSDFIIKITNQTLVIDGDAFSQLCFQRAVIEDGFAYEIDRVEEYFEYREMDDAILDIKLIQDIVYWKDLESGDNTTLDMQCAVVFVLQRSNLLIFARDTVAESVEIYHSLDILDERLRLEEAWPVLDEKDQQRRNVTYSRNIKPI